MNRLLFKYLRVSALIIATGVIPAIARAQSWEGGIGFQLGFPTDEYKEQVNTTAPGIAGEILYSPRRSPVGIGLAIGWLHMGGENRKEPFSTTIPDVTVDVETENGLAQFLLLLRLQPKNAPLLAYADGVLGGNYLYTKTTIKNASNGEDIASTVNIDDFAFAYGLGGGILIRVYSGKQKDSGEPLKVAIDLGLRYILGSEADYLKEGSIRRAGGQVAYDITRSKTNLAVLRIGVTANF